MVMQQTTFFDSMLDIHKYLRSKSRRLIRLKPVYSPEFGEGFRAFHIAEQEG